MLKSDIPQARQLLLAPYSVRGFEQLKVFFSFSMEKGQLKNRVRIKKHLRLLVTGNTKGTLILMPYSQYLETNYWRLIRFLVRNRDKNKCSVCKAEFNLHVHHLTYEHRGEEFNYLKDLTVLCAECHKTIHKDRPNYSKGVWQDMQEDAGKTCKNCKEVKGYKQFIWRGKEKDTCRKCIRLTR